MVFGRISEQSLVCWRLHTAPDSLSILLNTYEYNFSLRSLPTRLKHKINPNCAALPVGRLDEESKAQLAKNGFQQVETGFGNDWAAKAEFDFVAPAPDIEVAAPGPKVLRILDRRADGGIKVKFEGGHVCWTYITSLCSTPELLREYLACCGIRGKS